MGIKDKLFGHKCSRCDENRTKRQDKDGRYICADCELEIKMEKEKKRICPICQAEMKKEIVEDIIIDRCSKHGVWLDKGELDHLKEIAEDNASSGHSSGFVVGLACGSAMN